VEWLLNGVKMTLTEFTGYVMHMTNSRASVIKFMEKEISESVTGKIYLLIIYLFDNLMYLLLLIVDCVMLCYGITRKSVVL
jgi:hypothetical protein